jgi:hypothetical protein
MFISKNNVKSLFCPEEDKKRFEEWKEKKRGEISSLYEGEDWVEVNYPENYDCAALTAWFNPSSGALDIYLAHAVPNGNPYKNGFAYEVSEDTGYLLMSSIINGVPHWYTMKGDKSISLIADKGEGIELCAFNDWHKDLWGNDLPYKDFEDFWSGLSESQKDGVIAVLNTDRFGIARKLRAIAKIVGFIPPYETNPHGVSHSKTLRAYFSALKVSK